MAQTDDDVDAMLSALLEEDSPRLLAGEQLWGESVFVQALSAAMSEYKVGCKLQGTIYIAETVLGVCGCRSWPTDTARSRGPTASVASVRPVDHAPNSPF